MRSFPTRPLVSLAVPLLFCACTSAPPEPTTGWHSSEPSVSTGLLISNAQQLATTFEFPLHASIVEARVLGSVRYDGATESILQPGNTGGVTAWSLPAAPQMNVGWPQDAAHDGLARAYVIRVGVPETELGKMYHIRGRSSGAPVADPSKTSEQDLGASTTYERSVSGVLVPDSHAGVQLNAQGAPVSLSIIWPVIPSDVAVAAMQLQKTVADGWKPPSALLSALPIERIEPVIRHSRAGDSSLTWVAAIRTWLMSGTRQTYVDTDASGNRITSFDPPAAPISTK